MVFLYIPYKHVVVDCLQQYIYISYHRTSNFVQLSNKMDNIANDNNIVQCLRRSGSLNKTKEQQPFTLHNVAASEVQ